MKALHRVVYVENLKLIIAEVEDPQLLESFKVFDLLDAVVMQVEHVQVREVLEILHPFDLVLAEDQHA